MDEQKFNETCATLLTAAKRIVATLEKQEGCYWNEMCQYDTESLRREAAAAHKAAVALYKDMRD